MKKRGDIAQSLFFCSAKHIYSGMTPDRLMTIAPTVIEIIFSILKHVILFAIAHTAFHGIALNILTIASCPNR